MTHGETHDPNRDEHMNRHREEVLHIVRRLLGVNVERSAAVDSTAREPADE